jgi:hypothetical protein
MREYKGFAARKARAKRKTPRSADDCKLVVLQAAFKRKSFSPRLTLSCTGLTTAVRIDDAYRGKHADLRELHKRRPVLRKLGSSI